ncbi:MAG: hypothetical protein Crog4KO_29380 [Crocinitomicaceae bacterium]
MNKIFTASTANDLGYFTLEEALMLKTHGASDYIRSSSIILIGLNMSQDYNACKDFLLKEMHVALHFEAPAIGICSAWTLAIILAENLKSEDYEELHHAFLSWPESQQLALLGWLHGFLEQQNILKFGKKLV